MDGASLKDEKLVKGDNSQRLGDGQKKMASKKSKATKMETKENSKQNKDSAYKHCGVCEKTFDIKDFKEHLKVDKGFKCRAYSEKGFLLNKIKSLLNRDSLHEQ